MVGWGWWWLSVIIFWGLGGFGKSFYKFFDDDEEIKKFLITFFKFGLMFCDTNINFGGFGQKTPKMAKNPKNRGFDQIREKPQKVTFWG